MFEFERLRLADALRTDNAVGTIGVDRDAKVIRGVVAAQFGNFKSAGRGRFTADSLAAIATLGNAERIGLRSNFQHGGIENDGLGRHLGRVRDFYLAATVDRTGKPVPCVRANLHLDATALRPPPGGGPPLGTYVMDLAESDPGAISSSLVLRPRKEWETDSQGRDLVDGRGVPLPPSGTLSCCGRSTS